MNDVASFLLALFYLVKPVDLVGGKLRVREVSLASGFDIEEKADSVFYRHGVKGSLDRSNLVRADPFASGGDWDHKCALKVQSALDQDFYLRTLGFRFSASVYFFN